MQISIHKYRIQTMILIILRMGLGWQLFYAGYSKLIDPDWTAAYYLSSSKWILSGVFIWMSNMESLMQVVDFLNIWGLILIGIGLSIGLGTKMAAFSGAGLLLLYYIAHPPFAGMDADTIKEGIYFIVNKDLLEVISLLVVALIPTGHKFGVEYLIKSGTYNTSPSPEVNADNQEADGIDKPGTSLSRREILKNLATLPLFGTFFTASLVHSKKIGEVDISTGASRVMIKSIDLKELKRKIPMGKIGNLSVSRVFTGFNTFKGYAHARDLRYVKDLMRQYHTEEKIIQTFMLMEETGVNSMMLTNYEYRMFNKYLKDYNGKMQAFGYIFPGKGLIPWVPEDWRTQVDKQIDNGAVTMFICGVNTDVLVKNRKFDIISDIIEYIRSKGFLAGLAAHSITDFIECDKLGIEADYYLKSFHHDNYWSAHPREHRVDFEVELELHPEHHRYHDNIFCLYPEETVEYVQTLEKPLIAFKIFAGGAIPGEEAFQWAFENGADFVSCGMLDFQIIHDINLANEALEKTRDRNRIWYG